MFTGAFNFNQDLNRWDVKEDCTVTNIFSWTKQSYENVKDAFTEEQLNSSKILKSNSLNKVQKFTEKQGRGR